MELIFKKYYMTDQWDIAEHSIKIPTIITKIVLVDI